METKHTPGPWHANTPTEEQYADGTSIRESKHGDIVAIVDKPREGSCIANARLIAAAPDLLAACKVGLEALKDWSDNEGWYDKFDTDERVILLRAAIAKAERQA